MANVEDDDAGRLRAFRRKFGRGWDAKSAESEESLAVADSPPATQHEAAELGISTDGAGREAAEGKAAKEASKGRKEAAEGKAESEGSAAAWGEQEEDNLMDLISAAGLAGAQHKGPVAAPQKAAKAGKGKRK